MRRYTLVPLLVALVFAASVAAQPTARTAEAVPAGGITDVRFGDHLTHERAVLDFRASPTGEPPRISWNYREGDTVVRVRLPETRTTASAGGLGLGRAISHYRVVRAQPGWLYVDLHLTGAARSVNVFALDAPGRIVVDIVPGGTQLLASPAHANGAYVMTPRPGATVGPGELRVGGYARPFEASGVWRIKDSGGRIVSRGIYTTTDWTTAWGAYGFRTGYPAALSGERGTLEVGSLSARDGSFSGVSVPLRFR